ncbi:carbohydrate kinase [Kitasatospora sp. NPDC101801]|uniref:carbohydrate kinase family protein n=1 Tax=Kitasatospora sp. NPDC101801 TaxID=3364103 RepID=UPI0037FCD0FE
MTTSTPSFLVIGESVADIVRAPGRPDVPHPGGSPANVAYGLGRLGRPVALLTQLGDDEVGRLIAAHLRSAGVELPADGRTGVRTPTAIVTLDPDGRAGYTFDIHWSLRPVDPPAGADHVHLGSIAAVLPPGADAALGLLERLRPGASVSYDPNVRPALFGAPAAAPARVERCVALSDLVKASDEDLAWLYPGWSEQRVAEHWLGLGPALVLITRGGRGAAAFTPRGTVEAAAEPTAVVDTVGAGDAFMSATLDALAGRGLLGPTGRPALGALTPADLTALLRYAGRAAAITVSRAGATPPTAAELLAG